MSDQEILIVVSKLKNYIKSAAGMSTSGSVPAVLTEILKKHCAEAIEKAKADGRKTVMDRDFSVCCPSNDADSGEACSI